MSGLGVLLLLLWSDATLRSQEPPPQPPAQPQEAQAEEGEVLTLYEIFQMLQAGTPPSSLIARVEGSKAQFDLTVENVVMLRKFGASPQLIRLLARGGVPAAATAPAPLPDETAARPPQANPDALTAKKVLRMHRKGVPAAEIAAMVVSHGLKEPPDLDQLLEYRSQGVPAVVIVAMAGGPAPNLAPAPAPGQASGSPAPEAREESRKERPLKVADIRKMIANGQEPPAVVASIRERGIRGAPTLDEVMELRRLGATDEVLAAINQAAALAARNQQSEEEAGTEPAEASPAPPLAPAESADTFSVYSMPAGASVYLSSARTRLEESLQHGYLAGRTPLSLTLAPGDYTVIVQKEAGDFEAGLLPAWRTMHDGPGTRTVLDNADLTFDPASCCLPGSLSGTVDLHPVPEDQSRVIIGDEFDGLPPYLFDGETLQIMRVRGSAVTHVMKVYHVRKTAGQPRLLASTFVAAEGNPLDASVVADRGAGMPFEALVTAPELDYLGSAPGLTALASTLGFEADHLGAGVAMLRRAGKAILHQQLEGEIRLLVMAIDYGGRLRVTDRTVRPIDPFAAPPAHTGKKKKVAPPTPPPPLPGIERTVVPGLGLPRLSVDNATKHGLALLFSDGQFCFVPPSTTREFVVDPGTFDVKALSPRASGAAPEGRIHLSYHARYAMTFR
jgi:hypothetical protein